MGPPSGVDNPNYSPSYKAMVPATGKGQRRLLTLLEDQDLTAIISQQFQLLGKVLRPKQTDHSSGAGSRGAVICSLTVAPISRYRETPGAPSF